MLFKPPDKVGRISDDAVHADTGKPLRKWYLLLDKAGARMMEHPGIMEHLRNAHGLSPWWARLIAIGYERERGLRAAHQTIRNEAGRFKSMRAPVEVVWDAWTNAAVRERWLPGAQFEIVRNDPFKVLRLKWPDGSSVGVRMQATPARTRVTVSHTRLKEAGGIDRMHAYWTEALERLKFLVEARVPTP